MKKVTPVKKSERMAAVDLEPALLAAARKLLTEEGSSALSVRRIAEEAGVAPMGVYNRFENKNGIVEALFRQGFIEFDATLNAVEFPLGTERNLQKAYLESAVELCAKYREFAIENPGLYQMMFMKSVADFEPSSDALGEAFRAFGTLVARVEWGQRAKILVSGDSSEIGQRVWATCHGAASLEIVGIGKHLDHDRHFRLLVSTLFRGLLRAPK